MGPMAVVLNHTYGESEGFSHLGGAGAGMTGYPILLADGPPVPGQQVSVRLENAPPVSTGCLVVGLSALQLPWQGATLGPSPDLLVGPVAPSADGAAVITGRWPAGVPYVWLQFWLTAAQPQGGLAATSTVLVTP